MRGIRYDVPGKWSSVWWFQVMTEPLATPVLLSPGDKQVNVGTLTTFQWSVVPGAATYQIQVARDPDMVERIYSISNLEDTTLTLSAPLDVESTFHWRVRALNMETLRVSPYSEPGSFTTGLQTSIQEEDVVHRYALMQNYTNPFNPTTRIDYSLATAQPVSLELYTLTGERVMVLARGQRSAGVHSLTVEASDLASGVYIYRLATPDFIATRKLVVIK